MRRLIFALPLLTLACTAPPATPIDATGYVPVDYALPLAITTLLPRGVAATDVRERQGCYAYQFGDALYPVRRPDGGQYCIGA